MQAETTLVLGSAGFVGSNLALAASGSGSVVRHARSALGGTRAESVVIELTSSADVEALLDRTSPTIVVNCVALADVDRCERDRESAHWLNADLPGIIAAACAARGVDFVHISSDAVFGGSGQPHEPSDSTSPVNHYGLTKAEGELRVFATMPMAIVARTNVVGWSPTGHRSLLEFFHNRLSVGRGVTGFTDVYFRPLSVLDLWPAVTGWVSEVRSGHPGGPRHAVGDTLLSKFEFGQLVAEVFGFDRDLVNPGRASEAGLEAVRSHTLDLLPSPLAIMADGPQWPVPIRDALERLKVAHAGGLHGRLAARMSSESTRGAPSNDS